MGSYHDAQCVSDDRSHLEAFGFTHLLRPRGPADGDAPRIIPTAAAPVGTGIGFVDCTAL